MFCGKHLLLELIIIELLVTGKNFNFGTHVLIMSALINQLYSGAKNIPLTHLLGQVQFKALRVNKPLQRP